MKAYENGCTALKILRSKQGITLERVEDVMDEMNEVKKRNYQTVQITILSGN